jgi:hypothetical protein
MSLLLSYVYSFAGDVWFSASVLSSYTPYPCESVLLVLWFSVLGFINFPCLLKYSELELSPLRGWFRYASRFSCYQIFSFVVVYDVFSDIARRNIDRRLKWLFYYILLDSVVLSCNNKTRVYYMTVLKAYNLDQVLFPANSFVLLPCNIHQSQGIEYIYIYDFGIVFNDTKPVRNFVEISDSEFEMVKTWAILVTDHRGP